jgi:hypothetical protein
MDEQTPFRKWLPCQLGCGIIYQSHIAHPFGPVRDGQGVQRDFGLIWQWAVVDYGIGITF